MVKRSVLYLVLVLSLCCIPLVLIGVIGSSRQQITPNDQFFTLEIGEIPQLNGSTWSLQVDGVVVHPVNFSLAEVKALPSTTLVATLLCPSGPSGTAEFKGVLMNDLLELVQPDSNAFDVVFYAADGYSSSLTIDEANAADILLAYEMNGETLPVEQGFPLRLVAPGHYGYKWVKWIVHIEVVDYDFRGYWENLGWADNAQITSFSEWSLHAILFSIALILGAISLISGMKFTRRSNLFRDLPGIISPRFHRVLSIAYVASVVGVFVYWAAQTFISRGALFYTIHGFLALIAVSLHVAGAVLGRKSTMVNPNSRKWHFDLHLWGYGTFIMTIVLGFLLTRGTGILY